MAELPGKALAQELMQKSREESRRTPMEAVIEAAKQGQFAEEEGFRLTVADLQQQEKNKIALAVTGHKGGVTWERS